MIYISKRGDVTTDVSVWFHMYFCLFFVENNSLPMKNPDFWLFRYYYDAQVSDNLYNLLTFSVVSYKKKILFDTRLSRVKGKIGTFFHFLGFTMLSGC